MVTGPRQGRLSIAVRPIRPAQLAGWPRPVFTEITCAFATPARYPAPPTPGEPVSAPARPGVRGLATRGRGYPGTEPLGWEAR